MSFAGDVLGFENFNLKNTWKKLKDNPWRALVGSTSGAGTKLWNKVLNRNDEPLVDDWGGAPKDSYTKAQAAGINTDAGGKMHQAARIIAAYYAGSYGMSQLGAGAGAGGAEAGAGGAEAVTAPSAMPSIPSSSAPWVGGSGAVEGGLGTGTYTGGALSGGAGGGALGSGTFGGAETFSAGSGGAGGAPLWQRMMQSGLRGMQGGGGQQPNQGLEAGQEMLRRRREEEERRQEEERRRQVEQAMLQAQTQPPQQQGFM